MILLLLAGAAGAGIVSHRYDPTPHRFERIEAMVTMRDGVRLETVVLVPKHHARPLPILFRRSPYGVPPRGEEPSGWCSRLPCEGYIYAYQNIRGRFGSEGTFEMVRPVADHHDPKAIDESTDAYDSVEWLVHQVPGSTGGVCMRGVSYDGWTAAMALVDPHPALKCVTEQASPSDMFLNDDFHHNGAFRLSYGFEYAVSLETSKDALTPSPFDMADTYDWYLKLGALSHADERHLHGKIPTWENFVAHPNRDAFWEARAIGRSLAHTPVPNLNVMGWWDQEDMVGPLDIYTRLEKTDEAHTNFLLAGPWNHGGWSHTAATLGAVDLGSDTSVFFHEAQSKWFAHWLKGAPLDLHEVTAFETGANAWRSYDHWPPAGATETRLYLHAGGRASFEPPTESGEAFDDYVSDPAAPVPYRHRPISPTYPGPEWPLWLVEDQRFVDHRPDVLSWQTEPLDHDVVIAGDVLADLRASTTGTDADWVVKLIDVYPDGPAPKKDEAAESAPKPTPDMRGYELMIASEILRARFREGFDHAVAVPAGAVVRYPIDLHARAHAFQKGHRIMVQVQSTWFPVYDRNPQHFVENIFQARDEDYVAATQRVYRSREAPSSIVLPVMP